MMTPDHFSRPAGLGAETRVISRVHAAELWLAAHRYWLFTCAAFFAAGLALGQV